MNNIYRYLFRHDYDSKESIGTRQAFAYWFTNSFPESEFKNEDLIMWYAINYANKISVPFKEKYLEVYLNTELKSLILKKRIMVKGTDNLRLDDISHVDTVVQITKDLVMSEYYRLLEEDEEVEDFVPSVDEWMITTLNERIIDMYSSGYSMIDSIKNGKIGTVDALTFTSERVAELEDIYDRSKLEDISATYLQGEEQFRFVTDSGITSIDKDTGGIFTTQVFGIEAPTGYGKTRKAIGTYGYRCAVKHKRNVIYYALEQSKVEIENMFIARHIYEMYGEIITDSMIGKKVCPDGSPLTPYMKQLIEIAKIDLFESGKYGIIHIVETTLYMETFINTIKMHDKRFGPFDLVIIDYLTMLEQKGGDFRKQLQDYQIYKNGYKWFKRYIRESRKAGIAVNQLTGEESKNAENDKMPSAQGASGGQEARRSLDYVEVITASDVMKAQRKRRVSPAKKRSSEGDIRPICDTILGCCFWQQSKNVNDLKV